MRRREFLQAAGVVSVASLPTYRAAAAFPPPADKRTRTTAPRIKQASRDTLSVWHFHDLWRFDHLEGLDLRQGKPTWQRDSIYQEPHIGALSGWPTVYKHGANSWRMLYSAAWKPFSLMMAESHDGRRWRPASAATVGTTAEPEGGKLAPHHLYTLPDGSGGAVYLDPVAEDGFPFKIFVHQRGASVLERARNDKTHRWHQIAKDEGAKRYLVDEFALVSADGLNWAPRFEINWAGRDWHPEPPIFGFYNRHNGRHHMTVRPGWGDRRQYVQSSRDFHIWSGPETLLQPDALDEEPIELYGMPVFPYGDGYLGLLWIFHCESTERTRGFNRFVGPLDCQLAFSNDGENFVRGKRTPFIACNEPGEHGGGAIQPSSLVETEDEIRIYSAATKVHHGKGREARKKGIADNASILLHTLRKDGLMFLESQGDWGRFLSKPLVLLEDSITINALAPHGEVRYQLTDLESRPIEGFTWDECLPMIAADSLRFPLQWRAASLKDIRNRIVRLELRMRHARLYAVRGQMHFIDAQDRWMIEDGKKIAV